MCALTAVPKGGIHPKSARSTCCAPSLLLVQSDKQQHAIAWKRFLVKLHMRPNAPQQQRRKGAFELYTII